MTKLWSRRKHQISPLIEDQETAWLLGSKMSTGSKSPAFGQMGRRSGSMFKCTYYLSVLAVTIGASTQFYSYGIVNPEQELIMKWINETYAVRWNTTGLTETELNVFWSFVVSSIAIGAILGALLVRVLAEKVGRRNGLILNGAFNVFAAFLEFAAKPLASPELLIVGRLILGANMGLTSGLVPMYLMEITPVYWRGAAGTLHQVAVAFSDWFSLFIGLPEILGSENLWPIAFGFPGLLALFLVIVLPFCPESPKYLLVSRGKREDARDVLRRLVVEEEAERMFQELMSESVTNEDGLGSFRELFTRPDLRIPLAVSVVAMLAQQFTGCSTVFAYSTDMFLNAKLSPEAARLSTLAVGIAYFLFALSAPLLIERIGRRKLALFQLSMVTVSLTMMSTFTYIQSTNSQEWATYGTIFSLVFYMCVYGVGSPIPWMITSELFETKFRSAAVTLAVFVAWFLAFVISTVYLPFQQLVGISLSYVPFIVFSGIFTVALYFLLPETQHKPKVEVIEEFRYRAQSVTTGHPFRSVPPSLTDETQSLVQSEQDDRLSYHRYMSITGARPVLHQSPQSTCSSVFGSPSRFF
ncbi:unnamed protein product [Bursaphelenchus xylophilus]|uniref:(pine wood nematode) hypothetical protein n=1 Tax=Bursaphelenchus xylophilus TaxID=6326 RepID=A0A1I7S6F8_BURXY|nr:unnamed protein product [Bursaphelenchus xylophilus]CAG9128039.1 unnamed protein product [Bursaphelenchus xylophilus]